MAKPKVRWARVSLFYGLAFGWAAAVAAMLYLAGQRDLSGGSLAGWVGIVLALVYMPAPLLAALIVEKLDGRGYGLSSVFAKGWWKRLLPILVVVVVLVLTLLLVLIAASWLAGNVLGISSAGRLILGHEDLVANSIANLGISVDTQQVAAISAGLPSLPVILALTAVSAVVAGFTINGLFAFGEEYGWRGWLADELGGLGAFWANVITGILWGLWHAPLILLGYNYDGYPVVGMGFMVAWCVAASFLLWRVRQVTGSVLGPAVMHGAINGFAGVFVLLLVDANPVMAAPLGLVGLFAVAAVTGLFWLFTRGIVATRRLQTPQAVASEETAAL